ncbi:neuronal acetylcholine receptor subunit alpha-7-like [Haliotis rufescens]|uniref:neuronal acetylcholine receptor subunit alpha-7-like n=1 Tax=Haliotis rufescens TaxID=6454 RepID=UPI001EB06E52|nr:neuronal acetylcholine receptor subunit alpha-7-like [Haliotis rufescens]
MYVSGLYTEVRVPRLKFVTCGLYLLLFLGTARSQDDHHILRLHNDIIKNNNPKVRPVKNSSDTITVFLQLHLLSMSDFDEVTQTVTANGFFLVSWKDEFLTWNASEYGGVGEISPDYGMVWRPYITIRNVVDSVEPLGLDFGIIKVTANGIVNWAPGDTFKTFCQMDVTNFPLDEQECIYSTFNWGYTLKEVDLQPINNSIGLDLFNANSQWDIIYTSAQRVINEANNTPFPFVHFKMTLKRKPSLAILTTLLPVLMLGLVNVVVFLIPVESGEKLSFAITVLLSFTVSLSFVTGLLPQNGDSIPVFTIFIVGQFVMSSIYVFLTIWIVQVFHRDAAIRPVPSWMGRLTRSWERCFCGTPAVGNKENLTMTAWECPSVSWIRVSKMADRIMFCVFFIAYTLTTVISTLKIAYL